MKKHDQPEPLPTIPNLTVVLGGILSVAISAGALILAAEPDRMPWGVAASPFGWNRVVVVYSIATAMLSWGLTRLLVLSPTVRRYAQLKVIWIVLGIGIAVYTILMGPVVANYLSSLQIDSVGRTAVRIAWCLALQIPWFLLVVNMSASAQHPSRFLLSLKHLLAIGILTAVAVPASFLAVFLEEQTLAAERLWQELKVGQAIQTVQRLHDVGSTRAVIVQHTGDTQQTLTSQMLPAEALEHLRLSIIYFAERAATLEKLVAEDDAFAPRHELVSCYNALDRTDAAITVLETMSDVDAHAALRLARMLAPLDRPDDCRAAAEQVLRLARQVDGDKRRKDHDIEQQCYAAYDILVVLAGERGDFAEAERLLREAHRELPTQRAAIDAFLARHFEFLGDYAQAAMHQRLAAEAAPDRYARPDAIWKSVMSHGAPVGLARPKSSRYN
jgi:tetratricopeptide (TPR) repeat protein